MSRPQFDRTPASKRNFSSVSESEIVLINSHDLTPNAFNPLSTSDIDCQLKKSRSLRDAQAHRLIEKRRRDRMNSCLSDLDQLIQASQPKHRHGRVEKTEIIEMAIEHINYLRNIVNGRSCEDEDRFIAGFKFCRDETVAFLLHDKRPGLDSVDLQTMTLISHLQTKLDSLSPELDTKCTDIHQASAIGQYVARSALNSNSIPLHIKPESSAIANNNIEHRHELSTTCKQEVNEQDVETDQLSLASSSSSESRRDRLMDMDWTRVGRTSQLDPDSDVHRGRRRSFSECSATPSRTYKFKNYMKVRFKKDSSESGGHSIDKTANINKDQDSNLRLAYETLKHKETCDEGQYERGIPVSCSASSSKTTDNDSNTELPAFVAYPGSMFYVPIMLSRNHVMSYLQDYNNTAVMCHPICIKVNFSGPHIKTAFTDLSVSQ